MGPGARMEYLKSIYLGYKTASKKEKSSSIFPRSL